MSKVEFFFKEFSRVDSQLPDLFLAEKSTQILINVVNDYFISQSNEIQSKITGNLSRNLFGGTYDFSAFIEGIAVTNIDITWKSIYELIQLFLENSQVIYTTFKILLIKILRIF